jgi:hypothetical protein
VDGAANMLRVKTNRWTGQPTCRASKQTGGRGSQHAARQNKQIDGVVDMPHVENTQVDGAANMPFGAPRGNDGPPGWAWRRGGRLPPPDPGPGASICGPWRCPDALSARSKGVSVYGARSYW